MLTEEFKNSTLQTFLLAKKKDFCPYRICLRYESHEQLDYIVELGRRYGYCSSYARLNKKDVHLFYTRSMYI